MEALENHGALGVDLEAVAHAFQDKEVFAPITSSILPATECLIRGANGSGKSTLGQIISGELSPSAGSIRWSTKEESIDAEQVCHSAQRVSPATALHPVLSPRELVTFQGQFRTWQDDPLRLLVDAGMESHLNQAYQSLSSGMQQRVKLALSMACKTGILVLDEPCANLDESGKLWYRKALKGLKGKTTLIVCSNDRTEDFIAPDTTIDVRI